MRDIELRRLEMNESRALMVVSHKTGGQSELSCTQINSDFKILSLHCITDNSVDLNMLKEAIQPSIVSVVSTLLTIDTGEDH